MQQGDFVPSERLIAESSGRRHLRIRRGTKASRCSRHC